MNPSSSIKGMKRRRAIAGGTMLRVLGAAQKREVKATQNLSIIVLFFMICWIPLYTINFILAICRDCMEINSTVMLFCIILSHLNSAGNPVLYAYHLRDFRIALKNFLYSLIGKADYQSTILNTGYNCRPSLISNTPMDANFRFSSWREMQNMSSMSLVRQKRCMDTGDCNNQDENSLSEHPGISTIVARTATLAVAAATAGDPERKMWRISEVPSSSEVGQSHENSHNGSSSDNRSRIRTTSSGKINSGYLGDFISEEGDDDVFIDDTLPIDNGYIEGPAKVGSDENLTTCKKVFVRPVLNRVGMQHDQSYSFPQLSKNLFIVEDEFRNGNSDKSKKTFRSFKNGLKHSSSGDSLTYPNKTTNFNMLRSISKKFINSEKTDYNGSKGPPSN